MDLSRIILRLARNPGADHPEPDPHNGYMLVAPLSGNGSLDEAAFSRVAKNCVVRRFVPDQDARSGHLVRHGGHWGIRYDGAGDPVADEESVYRLHDHRFVTGDYVTIVDGQGEPLTYRVTEIAPATAAD